MEKSYRFSWITHDKKQKLIKLPIFFYTRGALIMPMKHRKKKQFDNEKCS